jgi:hypothetical protein
VILFLDDCLTYREYITVMNQKNEPVFNSDIQQLIDMFDENAFSFHTYDDAVSFLTEINHGNKEQWKNLPDLIFFGDDLPIISYNSDWESLLDRMVERSNAYFEAVFFNFNILVRQRMESVYRSYLQKYNMLVQ